MTIQLMTALMFSGFIYNLNLAKANRPIIKKRTNKIETLRDVSKKLAELEAKDKTARNFGELTPAKEINDLLTKGVSLLDQHRFSVIELPKVLASLSYLSETREKFRIPAVGLRSLLKDHETRLTTKKFIQKVFFFMTPPYPVPAKSVHQDKNGQTFNWLGKGMDFATTLNFIVDIERLRVHRFTDLFDEFAFSVVPQWSFACRVILQNHNLGKTSQIDDVLFTSYFVSLTNLRIRSPHGTQAEIILEYLRRNGKPFRWSMRKLGIFASKWIRTDWDFPMNLNRKQKKETVVIETNLARDMEARFSSMLEKHGHKWDAESWLMSLKVLYHLTSVKKENIILLTDTKVDYFKELFVHLSKFSIKDLTLLYDFYLWLKHSQPSLQLALERQNKDPRLAEKYLEQLDWVESTYKNHPQRLKGTNTINPPIDPKSSKTADQIYTALDNLCRKMNCTVRSEIELLGYLIPFDMRVRFTDPKIQDLIVEFNGPDHFLVNIYTKTHCDSLDEIRRQKLLSLIFPTTPFLFIPHSELKSAILAKSIKEKLTLMEDYLRPKLQAHVTNERKKNADF